MSTHLVIGAGSVGTEVATQLAAAGEHVVLVSRRGSGPDHTGIRRVAVDATSSDALQQCAPAAVAIYNCANPEYHRWVQDWPPLNAAFIEYAERTGAVLATCSNLYGYGPVTGPVSTALPLQATGTKGRVRAAMWREAKTLHDAGRIRATEVRASDFIAASEATRLGSSRVVPRILAGKSVSVIGPVNYPHSWTAPADVAALLIATARAPKAWGRAWHVPSNPPRTQRELVDDLADVAGVQRVPVKQVPVPITRVLGRFNPGIRELEETAHQWDRPFVIEDTESRVEFRLEPTPWVHILEDVISHYRQQA